MYNQISNNAAIFLSTPSARRATVDCLGLSCGLVISIHALREEGDTEQQRERSKPRAISIHALREEGDTSTDEQAFGYQISIHALREEGDG